MIFNKIQISNLFSYHDLNEFDFSLPVKERNIVLISGRNGYGKTSFLNCIRLLFTGVTESLRILVQRSPTPSQKQYVIGTGDDWWGIMNRRARNKGKAECSIRIHWQEKDGKVKAERKWLLFGDGYEENLSIKTDFFTERLKGDDAQRFLDQRLPRDYLPFFFFDGEQIQELAEANTRKRQKHIEGLLNLTSLDTLIDSLNKAGNKWKRTAMDREEEATLAEFEAKLKIFEARYAAGVQKRQDLDEKIKEIQDENRVLDRRMDNMRSFVHQTEESQLKKDQKNFYDKQDELGKKIVDTLPRDIVLLANVGIVRKTINELKEIVLRNEGVQSGLLEELKAHLPHDLFERSPHPRQLLKETQKNFYKKKLTRLLETYLPHSDSDEGFIKINGRQASNIIDDMQPYVSAEAIRSERIRDLQEIHEIKVRLKEIDEQLTDVSNLSVEEKNQYKQNKARYDELTNLLVDRKADLHNLNSEQDKLVTRIRNQKKDIEKQRDVVDLTKEAKKKVDLSKRLKEMFISYKNGLKKQRREEIETAINLYFNTLMTSHKLINHIDVGEDFDLRYEDASGNPVPTSSISAGMKQLMATALLWALKDVSEKQIPVIVDTPLARIDREHQENLLKLYYPNVGKQVIILPTNSELDLVKYNTIAPYIYKEFKLDNPEGDQTRIEEISMYPENEVNTYG